MGGVAQDCGGITRQFVKAGFTSPVLSVWLKVKRLIYWLVIQPWIAHLSFQEHVVEKGAMHRRAVALMRQLAEDPMPLLEGTAGQLLDGPQPPNPGLDAVRA